MYDLAAIGENIRYYRKKMGFTQTALASRLHVSFQAVSGWERGNPPEIDNLCRLAEVFGVSVDTLLSRNHLGNEVLLLGVDGGTTKTDFALFTPSGQVLDAFRLFGSNPNIVGVKNAVSLLQEGIERCLRQFSNLSGIFLGLAGVFSDDIRSQVHSSLQSLFPGLRIFLETDTSSIFSCAHGDIALICGTGSVIVAREGNVYHRIGGWGGRYGDPCSAFDIGREGMRAALAYEDKIGPQTQLLPMIRQMIGLELYTASNLLTRQNPDRIAALAPVVFSAAALGDEVSAEILERNARTLCQNLNAARTNYRCGNRVIACGGVLENHHAYFVKMFQKYALPDTEFIYPDLPVIYGACVACCDRLQIQPDPQFHARFKMSYLHYHNRFI